VKLSLLFEIGAHRFVDVGTEVADSPSGPNSTVLPTAGARASVDLAWRPGPMVGWWLEYQHDLGSATIDTGSPGRFGLGGSLVQTGLQVGFDLQR
jgi:hypothetical protein